MKGRKKWYEYLWIASAVYLALGFVNILFAWLGLICFLVPLGVAVFGGGKAYCNRYCGRGQLFQLLGGRFGLSRGKPLPRFFSGAAFRYGFMTFFLLMFVSMLRVTFLVGAGAADLRQFVTLLWTVRVPWQWAYHVQAPSGVAQFAFGFYSVMLTSTLLGFLMMALYKPRSWCAVCPMGTMTQGICKLKERKEK